eukprot:3608978-Amphidinium_carterae.1
MGPPPQAEQPTQTGEASAPAEVATGATSKAAPKTTGGKRPPPLLPEVKDETPPLAQQAAAPPAALAEVAKATMEPPVAVQNDALQQAAAAPVPEQLEAVAKAARILTARGFATQAQEVALKAHTDKEEAAAAAAPPQWAGYRPGQQQNWAGYRSEQQQTSNKWTATGKWSGQGSSAGASTWYSGHASAWQSADWDQEPDETGYGLASEHHPRHQASQPEEPARNRGWQRKPRGWEHQPSDENNKSGPGGPDRREKGSRPRQAATARYSVRDLFVDADPTEVRIWGNEDKITALGRPGAAALATGNRQAAGRSLRNTERVFIKLMQVTGKLEPDKRAFGYRPTFRQLGRIRAFMDHHIDFSNFAEEIWGDTDNEQEEPLEPQTGNQGSGTPASTQPSSAAAAAAPPPEQTTAQLFNSKKPRTLAVRAMLEQAELKQELDQELQTEESDEGFHDPRDDADESGKPTGPPGEPATFEDVEEYQPSLQDELMQRAAEAVAREKASPSNSPLRDEADYDNDSDL